MAELSDYLVVPAETVVGGRHFDDVDSALEAAALLVKGDRGPRIVLRVVAALEADPKPNVVTKRYDGADIAGEAVQP